MILFKQIHSAAGLGRHAPSALVRLLSEWGRWLSCFLALASAPVLAQGYYAVPAGQFDAGAAPMGNPAWTPGSYAAPEAEVAQAYRGQEAYDDYAMFYDSLSPYGDWFYVPAYGYVWYPYVNHATWRPYMDNGYWAWTDYGWTWVSLYEWGWAPFHYGRWVWLDSFWVWVPDTVWGPAWVAWRYTDDYAGWAPLPPGAYWYPDYGLEISVHIPVSCWIFVPGIRIVDVDIYRHVLPRQRTSRVYYASRPSTVYRVQGGMPVAVGIDLYRARRWIGAPIPQIRVQVTVNAGYARGVQSNGLTVYRPPMRTSRSVSAAPPAPRYAAPASLQRVASPPPPSRKGVSPSQQYRIQAEAQRPASASRTRATSPVPAVVPPGAVPPPARAVPPPARAVPPPARAVPPPARAVPPPARAVDAQRAVEQRQLERRDLHEDRRQLREEKRELRETLRTSPGDREASRAQQDDVRDSRREVHEQRRATREVRQERQESTRERTSGGSR